MDTTRVRIILLNIVLLDADVIMDMHRFNIWDQVLQYHIFMDSRNSPLYVYKCKHMFVIVKICLRT